MVIHKAVMEVARPIAGGETIDASSRPSQKVFRNVISMIHVGRGRPAAYGRDALEDRRTYDDEVEAAGERPAVRSWSG